MGRLTRLILFGTACVLPAIFVYVASLVAPPEPKLVIGKKPVADYAAISGSVLDLSISIDQPDESVLAVLYLDGAETASLSFQTSTVSFDPVLLAPGETEAVIEMRRQIGPFASSRWNRLRLTSKPPEAVEDVTISVPDVIWTDRLWITGTAPAEKKVSILVDDKPATLPNASVWTDKGGKFKVEIQLPAPGSYQIKAIVETVGNGAKPLISEETTIKFLARLPDLVSRSLFVTVDNDDFRWDLEARFEIDDPRVKAFIERRTSTKSFVRRIHGDILLNDAFYPSMRFGAPLIETNSKYVQVTISTNQVPTSLVPNDRIEISRFGGLVVPSNKDIIKLRFKGLEPAGFFPFPKSITDGTATWNGGQAREDEVGVFLAAPPSGRAPLWALKPQDVLPNWLIGFFYDGLAVIPMLWLLQILRKGLSLSVDDSVRCKFSRDIRLLGVLALFGSTQYVLAQLGYLYREPLRDFLQHPFLVAWLRSFFESFVVESGVPIASSTLNLSYNTYHVVSVVAAFTSFWAACMLVHAFIRWIRPGGIATNILRDLVRTLLSAAVLGFAFELVRSLIAVRIFQLDESLYGLDTASRGITMLICWTIAIVLLRRFWKTATWLSGRQIETRRVIANCGALALLILIVPRDVGFDPLSEPVRQPLYDVLYAVRDFLEQIGNIAPLVAMFLVCITLVHKDQNPNFPVRRMLALMLFAGVLVGVGSTWVIFPVPLLLAVVLFSPIVMMPKPPARVLRSYREEILENRGLLLASAYEHARNFAPAGGLFGSGLFKMRLDDKKSRDKYKPLNVTLPDGSRLPATDLAFAYGPHRTATANALSAVRVGAWGAVFFVVIYALPIFVQTDTLANFPYFWGLMRVISVGGYWLIGAFFLGYFYELIRGTTGWKKGMWLALGISIAGEPLAILNAISVADFAAIIISVIQRFAFFILVGLIAFDWRTFRDIRGSNFEWRLFRILIGLSVMEALASVFIAGAGVAISSTITGQLATALTQVANELLPTINPPPELGR